MRDPLAAAGGEPPSLTYDTDNDHHAVDASLRELTSRLVTTIPSFLGLSVTLVGDVADLTLTAVAAAAAAPARTSLAFSTGRPGGGSARFTLFAHQAGALVDLQADLAHLGRRAGGRAADGAPRDVRLDQDLPGAALEPALTGLAEQSTVCRAEGVLIDEGVAPDRAASELRRRAARAGSDVHPYAAQLLVHTGTPR